MLKAVPRILEIGDFQYFKQIYPEQTTSLWTGWRPSRVLPRRAYDDCTPLRFAAAMRDAAAGRYGVVVAYMSSRAPKLPRYWLRAFARQPWRPISALTRVFGVSWLQPFKFSMPFVVLDMNDTFGIGAHNFFLLDKADVAFKRELPADRWHVLFGSGHPNLPTQRIRGNDRWQARLAKLRPIALPVPRIDPKLFADGFPEKTVDVFFAGEVEKNNWVRRTGLSELKALAERGVQADLPEGRLPRQEFYRRLARAWLAWSPAGYSWECYRTGEAAQCMTVPIVSHPTVERYRPLLDGEHLFQYDIEPGGLTRVVEKALADKGRLQKMAAAGRDHVLKHHTLRGIVDHVLETALAAAPIARPNAS
ncbi:MAG: glycosyltransferase [Xanthobacteraceae bacterium]